MTFGYSQPFSFQISPRPEPIVSRIRHGVTEIALSDGRVVRATLHVKAVKTDPQHPGRLDVSYSVVAELINAPAVPIMDVHETIQ